MQEVVAEVNVVAAKAVVVLEGVSEVLRGRTILEDVSLEVSPAQIVGLSGLNGSGKSTLLKIISGFIVPTRGRVVVFGKEIGKEVEFPDKTGVLIEKPGFLTYMSGMKNLELLASIRGEIGKEDIREVIKLVGLDPDDKRPVRAYSTGMIQRLGIAQALMEHPELLLLDEPTSNLDREGITIVHTVLKELQEKGITILLTSPNMEELRHICDTIFWVENGRLGKEPPQML
jgi:ABC-2 type transport system ATP-binding protein